MNRMAVAAGGGGPRAGPSAEGKRGGRRRSARGSAAISHCRAEQQEQDTEAVDAVDTGEHLDCMTPFVVQRDALLLYTDRCSSRI